MNSGSRPCAPRYFEVTASAVPWPNWDPGAWPRMPSPPPPPICWLIELSVPVSLAMICSTGPPGANCTIVKLISMMPIIVGTMRSARFRR